MLYFTYGKWCEWEPWLQCLNVRDSDHFAWIHSLWNFWLDILFYNTRLPFLLLLIKHLWRPQVFAINIFSGWLHCMSCKPFILLVVYEVYSYNLNAIINIIGQINECLSYESYIYRQGHVHTEYHTYRLSTKNIHCQI